MEGTNSCPSSQVQSIQAKYEIFRSYLYFSPKLAFESNSYYSENCFLSAFSSKDTLSLQDTWSLYIYHILVAIAGTIPVLL